MPRPAQTPSSPWRVRRSPAAAAILVQLGREHGLSASDCLAGTGLTPRDLDDSSAQIEAEQELTIARNLLTALGHRPGLGCAAGRRHTLGTTGTLGFALIASATLREGIEVALRYAALSPTFLRPRLEEDGRWARIWLDDTHLPDDLRTFLLERDLAAIGGLLPVLFGEHGPARLAVLDVRLRPGPHLAQALPGVRIRYCRPRNVLTFPSRLLQEPLPSADPQIARLSESQCRDLLHRRLGPDGTVAAVRDRLRRRTRRPPSMAEVAAELNITTRTLHRRLERAGTSFRALADEARQELAVELLTTTALTVGEIARRLGYSETAAFTHAFTRRHGVPPSRYRKDAAERDKAR
ncbi:MULTISPECIES: AraC family transcriptional regulator [Thermomonospora]|uniref:Transcriptional regulator, AraC family n=1 Tax=Thermomonospora curvata (strain ATCC 19995 / DSM 43183 / JCM 3096 / KCTC 9072 / NBRC 15933 / NCIMB 10081 / Henssen B9) TaxID=471852 RepID=D1AE55_THECD|nr:MULTISPECIES: AraC family transcriptional regulator [Thermomonospora]ACY99481.1 transcriptional regulator, AraC family [Thermomonospora curvata DSM 43183]PKK12527.1 MAG: AraC family transcriptional regulator [Thermomonospora sp. CIF 1]